MLQRRVEMRGVRLEEDPEGGPEPEEEQLNGDREQRVGPNGFGGLARGGGGQVALHDGLVGHGGVAAGEDAADDGDPDGGGREVPGPIEGVKLISFDGGGEGRAESTVDVHDDEDEGEYGSKDEHDGLDYVGPNDRLDAAEDGVERGEQAHREDAEGDVHAGGGREGDRGQVEDDGHAAELKGAEDEAAVDAREEVKTLLEVFVGGRDGRLAQAGHVVHDDEGREEEDADAVQDEDPVAGVGRRGDRDVGNGADGGTEDADADGPPRDAAVPEEEGFRVVLAPRKVEAHPHEEAEVETERGIIDQAEAASSGCGRNGVDPCARGARFVRAAHKGDCAVPMQSAGPRAAGGGVQQCPGIGDGMIGQQKVGTRLAGIAADLLVDSDCLFASVHEYMRDAVFQGGGVFDRRGHLRDGAPAGLRREAMGVGEPTPGSGSRVRRVPDGAACEIERAVPDGQGRADAGRNGPWIQHLPSCCRAGKIERPKMVRGPRGARGVDAAEDVDRVADGGG